MHGFANEEHPHSHLLCWNKKQTLHDMQVNNLLTIHCCRNELRANFLSFRIFFYTLFVYFFVFSLSRSSIAPVFFYEEENNGTSAWFPWFKKKITGEELSFLSLSTCWLFIRVRMRARACCRITVFVITQLAVSRSNARQHFYFSVASLTAIFHKLLGLLAPNFARKPDWPRPDSVIGLTPGCQPLCSSSHVWC